MITDTEWKEVGELFQDYYSLFYAFWKIGNPIEVENEDIKTAAVSFDRSGEYLNFQFNTKFWNRCSTYERAFVVAHECLHVLLSHGLRSKDTTSPEAANVAMDVVVNHMLVDQFGFDRNRIDFQNSLCWIDTVWAKAENVPNTILIPSSTSITEDQVLRYQNFEYYYNLFEKIEIPLTVMILDNHSSFSGKDFSKIMKKIAGSIGTQEAQDAQDAKKADTNPKGQAEDQEVDDMINQQAGTGTGDWSRYDVGEVKKKKTWETLFKKFFKMWSEKVEESWARTSRRLACLPEDIIIPSEFEDDTKEKELISAWLFLDVSGSCSSYRSRFIKAYMSIPKDKFKIKLYSFDTQTREVDVVRQNIYGGGGTSFSCIEHRIQSEMQKENKQYPQIVMVFTDGYGTYVKPEHPTRWYWFLENRFCATEYIPKQSKVLYLQDFE